MTPEQMEQRLGQRPSSPLFARLALQRLEQGDPARGAMLCRAGLERFPGYATAHLVLARCLAAQREYDAALGELAAALRLAAQTQLLGRLQADWEAERAAAEAATQAGAAAVSVETLPPVTEQPPGAAAIAAGTVPPAAEPLAETPPEPVLPQPSVGAHETAGPAEAPREHEPALPARGEEDRIVTRTLAEIYARQGEYLEAIITYQLLKRQRPELAGEFEERIQELEIKLQEKLAG